MYRVLLVATWEPVYLGMYPGLEADLGGKKMPTSEEIWLVVIILYAISRLGASVDKFSEPSVVITT